MLLPLYNYWLLLIIINNYWLWLSPTGLVIYLNHRFRNHYEDIVYIPFYYILENCKSCRLQSLFLTISGSNEREFVVTVLYIKKKKKKEHECCYNVDFTRGRKALCDTRCNTFLHSVLLCAYTDYYDHCDYYDDGNFFHNSPLLHSLVSTMQLWCYYIINTIVWLSPFFSSFLRLITHYTRTRDIHTHTRQKTPQVRAIDSKQSICTTAIAIVNVQHIHETVSLLVARCFLY